ncbi:MAG: RDD family protein [Malacoplasma sp.]|nr:RDD family protein [Malacoplasma sp.]
MNNILEKNEKKKYNLASAISRTFARFFDLIFTFLIIIAFFFVIFSNLIQTNFLSNNEQNWNLIESWQIFLFTLVIFLTIFIYFIVVPFLCKGYTIFSKVFKIRIYSTSLKIVSENRKFFKNLHWLFFVQLIIRESLTCLVMIVITLILGIVSFFAKSQVIAFLLNVNNEPNTTNVVEIVFQSFYTIAAILEFVLILNVAFTNKRRSFTDNISNTVVVKMVEVFSDDKNGVLNLKNKKKPIIKYNLPGEIDTSEIFEKGNDKNG